MSEPHRWPSHRPAAGRPVPVSTYRLQVNADQTFADVARAAGDERTKMLPQRSARRAEGSWSAREEQAREAPTLSCRTGRGMNRQPAAGGP